MVHLDDWYVQLEKSRCTAWQSRYAILRFELMRKSLPEVTYVVIFSDQKNNNVIIVLWKIYRILLCRTNHFREVEIKKMTRTLTRFFFLSIRWTRKSCSIIYLRNTKVIQLFFFSSIQGEIFFFLPRQSCFYQVLTCW